MTKGIEIDRKAHWEWYYKDVPNRFAVTRSYAVLYLHIGAHGGWWRFTKWNADRLELARVTRIGFKKEWTVTIHGKTPQYFDQLNRINPKQENLFDNPNEAKEWVVNTFFRNSKIKAKVKELNVEPEIEEAELPDLIL